MRRTAFLVLLTGLSLAPWLAQSPAPLQLPLQPKSVRFAVIGDTGTGEKPQYDVGKQMAKWRANYPFEFVLMLGDNIYGSEDPAGFKKKFEDPYKELLDGGVKFYASLGNHDNPNERLYKPFNMGGQRYYSFKNGDAEFFALDSTYMDATQLNWLQTQLSGSRAQWKICFFHHPLYSHGMTHGSDTDLRARLEPIFMKNGVNVVLCGHDHIYERLKPQNGIYHFVLGNAGQLRAHDLKSSPDTAKGFDTDQSFMLVEIAGDVYHFQTISRVGNTIDSGTIEKQPKPAAGGSN